MRDRRAPIAVGACALAIAVFAGGPAAAAAPEVTLDLTIAAAGDSVAFSAQSDASGPDDCEVQLNGTPVGGSCSVDLKGQVTGALTVPPDEEPGFAKVAVCQPVCDDPDSPRWSGNAVLEIGVRVPAMGGERLSVAGGVLGELGLAAVPDPETADDDWIVEQQDPVPGVVVPVKSPVVLTVVAPAPALIEVPSVVGRSLTEAQDILRDKGFDPEVVGDGTGPVVRQEPPAGESRPRDTVVDIWLRPPTPPDPAEPPDLSELSPSPGRVDAPTSADTAGSSSNPALPPTSADPASPSPSAPAAPTDRTQVGSVVSSADWPGAGLSAAVVLVTGVGAYLTGRAVVRRRRGARWVRHHVRVTAHGGRPRVGSTTHETSGDTDHSVQVVGRRPDAEVTMREF